MYREASAERRSNLWTVVVVVALMLSAWMVIVDRSAAAPATPAAPAAAALQLDLNGGEGGSIYAKYAGIDGESIEENHDKWIEVLAIGWGAGIDGLPADAPVRVRRDAVVDGFMLSFDYEKASPKLEEKLFTGGVIPLLEVELTATFGENRATYLRYELKNVLITDFDVTAMTDGGRPTVTFTNTFEEIKVTYTEYDREGNAKGNVEYVYEVE